jgi:drug/metabolite transporter superfamily protein YnfA
MNWLDDYIKENEKGYLINAYGGLFVAINKVWVRHVKGDGKVENLKEIPKEEFIQKLIS